MVKTQLLKTKTVSKQYQAIGEIPEGWQECLLGDVANFKNGKSSPERDDSFDYNVFGSNGIIGRSEQCNSSEGTVIIGRVGSYCGSVYFSKSNCWVTDNAMIGLAREKTNSRFLYYLLLNLNLNNHRAGSGQPLLNQGILNSIKISVPNISEQQAIAKILSDLDEKIELNQRMNKTLEAIGHALFRQWFVVFEFPDKNGKPYKPSGGKMIDSELGEIPEGWDVKPLDQVAEFLNGLALQKFPQTDDRYLPAIKIRELNQGITESSDKVSPDIGPEYVVDDGDILFSWSGSLQICIWCHGKGALNQHLFKVTSLNYPKWFFFYWTSFHLPEFQQIAEGKATTMGHIQRRHLSAALVMVPQVKTLENMTRVMSPIIDRIIVNSVEVRKLSEMRDSLLPRLMSGEIRV